MTAQAQRGKKSLTKTLGNYSFILIFAVILIAYLIINGGATTLSGVMNILRHSAVVGIMALAWVWSSSPAASTFPSAPCWR